MKALVYTDKETIIFRDEPKPVPAENEALVKITSVGICGSDMHAYHGHDPRRVPPLILGHEACGIVESGQFKGQRVVLNPLLSCGKCHDCLTGRANLCVSRTAIGLKRPGAFAQYTTIPESNLIVIPEDMPTEFAALAEPAATAVHAVALAEKAVHRPLSENRVLVIGAGSIGLLCALLLKNKGCRNIVLSDTNSLRLDTAVKAGINNTHNPVSNETLGENNFDLVIDAVGCAPTRNTAVQAVSQGGVILHVGLQDSLGTFDVRKVTLQEITFIGAFSYTQTDIIAAVDALYSGALGDLNWIEHRNLSEGAAAFDDLNNGRTAAAKIILNCEAAD
ncbi:MAG: alcohol dehydrogenase catalytic domain-containing protein [Psychromonas sp.]